MSDETQPFIHDWQFEYCRKHFAEIGGLATGLSRACADRHEDAPGHIRVFTEHLERMVIDLQGVTRLPGALVEMEIIEPQIFDGLTPDECVKRLRDIVGIIDDENMKHWTPDFSEATN